VDQRPFGDQTGVAMTEADQKVVEESLDEAIQLFRENETMFGDIKQDKEKANLYRGLAALAEALQKRAVDGHKS
jgi:hypothetical protein